MRQRTRSLCLSVPLCLFASAPYAAYARLTTRLAPLFSARCTARAYRVKFSPAHGWRMKKSSGNASPLSWLHRKQAITRFPGACVPPREMGSTWSSVANSGVRGVAQYTQRRLQSRIVARLTARF